MKHRRVFRIMAEDAITAKEHCECGEGSVEVIELSKYNNVCDEVEKCYDYDKRIQKIIELKIKMLKDKARGTQYEALEFWEGKIDELEELLQDIKEII